jgi:hypothetical protein
VPEHSSSKPEAQSSILNTIKMYIIYIYMCILISFSYIYIYIYIYIYTHTQIYIHVESTQPLVLLLVCFPERVPKVRADLRPPSSSLPSP